LQTSHETVEFVHDASQPRSDSQLPQLCGPDVALDSDVVLIGENRVGKSNFIFALRLVLDADLPDSARQLKRGDIWDGFTGTDPVVEVHLDFADFDSDPPLTALLTDYRLATDHTIARLSYVFLKKADVKNSPKTDADFEFKVYGGGDETRALGYDLRRRLCLDLLNALRDAEGELGTWRTSPLTCVGFFEPFILGGRLGWVKGDAAA